MIKTSMIRLDSMFWGCAHCDFKSKYQSTVGYHIEAKHFASYGVQCEQCSTVCPTRQALKMHISRKHRGINQTEKLWFQIWKIWSILRLTKPQIQMVGFVLTVEKLRNGKPIFLSTLKERMLKVQDIIVMSVISSVKLKMPFVHIRIGSTRTYLCNRIHFKTELKLTYL